MLLNCTIPERCQFVRKHYFYADMPAGYQITQQNHPIAHSDILRIQLEHDSGRTIHDFSNNRSLIDFNRAGVALLEIVTSPTINSALEAYCFIEQLRLTLMENDLCEGEMQKAQFRVDVNISLGGDNTDNRGVRTEIKNLNSLRMVYTAVNSELGRQYEILRAGGTVLNETRTVDRYGNTIAMREKKIEMDYRFMPEPNLPPVQIKQEWIENCRLMLSKPRYLKNIEEYGMGPEVALQIAVSIEVYETCKILVHSLYAFDETIVCMYFVHIAALFISFGNKTIFINHFVEAVHLFHTKRLTKLTTFDLLRRYIEAELDKSPTEIINEENLWRIHDKDEIIQIVEKVIRENDKLVRKIQKSGAKRHATKLRAAILSECNRRIEADEISEIIRRKLLSGS
ncbi:unnamed protein product [Wuchereria bancrofti]|uniref:Glutamyl-tRNA(Gln) amidotransferase subunit B, mitochondrial n=1 Tax=Wuchereria bancrofti TaxID=6293 RepID=A0A3P7DY85_WUCBA|nr:unnamed protein product [Wuchereria bancrofti]